MNVFGDCVGCGIVDRYAPRFLPPVGVQSSASSSSGGGAVGEDTSLIKEGEGVGLPMEGSADEPEQPVDDTTNSTLM